MADDAGSDRKRNSGDDVARHPPLLQRRRLVWSAIAESVLGARLGAGLPPLLDAGLPGTWLLRLPFALPGGALLPHHSRDSRLPERRAKSRSTFQCTFGRISFVSSAIAPARPRQLLVPFFDPPSERVGGGGVAELWCSPPRPFVPHGRPSRREGADTVCDRSGALPPSRIVEQVSALICTRPLGGLAKILAPRSLALPGHLIVRDTRFTRCLPRNSRPIYGR